MNEATYLSSSKAADSPPQAESEKIFDVKLYHPVNGFVPCRNQGISVRFELTAPNSAVLRKKVESKNRGIFKGECCVSCSARAKVSVNEKIDANIS